MIKRIKRDGVVQPVDSCTSYIVPKLLRAGAIDLETPGADLPGLRWNRKSEFSTFLAEEDEDPIAIQSMVERFVHVPRHDLPDSVRANPSPEDMAWYAIFEDSTLEIVDLVPGAEWMLQLLIAEDLPLVGCFTVQELTDSIIERRKQWGFKTDENPDGDLGHVIGKMQVNWFRYANTFVKGNAGA